MSRGLLMPLLLFWIGCSETPVPSGFLNQDSEPKVLFRCEGGRIAAYITLDAVDEVDAGIPDGAVPVQLDSAPACQSE